MATSFDCRGSCASASALPETPGNTTARPTAADALTSAAVRMKSLRVTSMSGFILIVPSSLKIRSHPLNRLVQRVVGKAVVVPGLVDRKLVRGAIERVHLLRLGDGGLHIGGDCIAIKLRLHHQDRPGRDHREQVLIVIRNLRLM